MKKVLIVDDSRVVREYLKKVVSSSEEFEVVGEAGDGERALRLAEELNPDVILMDVVMPKLDGLEATRRIMEKHPVPVLIFSSTVDPRDVEYAYHAVKMGAVDVMPKPDMAVIEEEDFRKELIRKLRIVSNVRVIRRARTSKRHTLPVIRGLHRYSVLAIGASTGGPAAVSFILANLKSRAYPVILIQHIAHGFESGFVNWLKGESGWDVVLAKDGLKPEPGKVYVAPSGAHLVMRWGRFFLDYSPPVKSCRPSIDVAFSSLAEEFGPELLAILLTGIGDDGVEGCRKVREKGGYVIAQDETTSVVYGMPRAAAEAKVVDTVLPLDKISELAQKLLRK